MNSVIRYTLVFIVVSNVVSAGVFSVSATAAAQTEVPTIDNEASVEPTVMPISDSGVSIKLRESEENEYLDTINDIIDDRRGLDPRSNAFLWFKEDGTTAVIVTDETPQTGSVEFEGISLSPDNIDYDIVIASDISFETRGESVDYDEVVSNKEEYNNKHIRLTERYQQFSVTADWDNQTLQQQLSYGGFTPDNQGDNNVSALPLGEEVEWISEELSTDAGSIDEDILQERAEFTDSYISQEYGTTRYWARNEATVDVVVRTNGEQMTFHVANVSWKSTDTTVDKITNGLHDGDVVSVSTDRIGTKISTKQTLLSLARCGPESVTLPGVGCVPVPADSTIDTGVLYNGSETLYYLGLSNEKIDVDQGESAITVSESSAVTGKVINASEINPHLDGRAIVAYDTETTGDIEELPGTIEEQKEQIENISRNAAETPLDVELTLSAEPTTIEEGETVEFTLERDDFNSQTTGNLTIYGPNKEVADQVSIDGTLEYTFETAGNYTVEATKPERNEINGSFVNDTEEVAVSNHDDNLEEVELTLSAEPTTIEEGETVEFTLERDDFNSQTTGNLTIYDPNEEVVEQVSIDGTLEYTFETAGNYTVEATKPDQPDDGKSFINDTEEVVVTNRDGDRPTDSIQLQFDPSEPTLEPGQQETVDIVIENVNQGVNGYEFTVEISDHRVVSVTDAELVEFGGQFANIEIAENGSSVYFEEAVTDENPANPAFTIARLAVTTGESSGTTQFTVRDGAELKNNEGNSYDLEVQNATVEVAPDVTGNGDPSQDLDGDGLYEDVDGDGEADIFDVQAFFDNRNSDAVQNNPELYNFDGQNGIDIFDVQALYSRL